MALLLMCLVYVKKTAQCAAQMHTGKPKPPKKWKPWRSLATGEHIKALQAVKPKHNNYDGRNHITE